MLWDLSEYDGIAVEVASEEAGTYKVLLTDDRFRIPSYMYWEGLFETQGGLVEETVYIPFENFYPTAFGFSMWPYRWIIPFGGLKQSGINSVGF